MPGIHIKQFAGLMPELAARNMPHTCAQIAHNCLLRDGSLRPLPRWKKFHVLTTATSESHIYEDEATGALINAYDYGEAVYLNGEPFANRMVVGINNIPAMHQGFTSNVMQTLGIGDAPSISSYPAGIPTPMFIPTVVEGEAVEASITDSSVGYTAQMFSDKPVNRIMGVTFCRLIGGGMQEGPIGVIPGQAPFGVMFEGDIVNIMLELNMSFLRTYGITHVRLYRTISGLDSGEKVGNELDTDWHLVDTIDIRGAITVINYNDGGAVTTDPMDLYLSGNFYMPKYNMQHFGLTEGGWFYGVSADGKISISERYLHYAWPVENYLDIKQQVTSAATHFDNIYIGTSGYPYIVALAPGEGPQGLQAAPQRFPERLPCLPDTMVAAAAGALYTSPKGVVALSRSGQRVITAGITNADDVLYKKSFPYVEGPPEVSAYTEEVRFSRALKAAYHEGVYYGICKSYQPTSEALISRHGFAYHTGDEINGDNKFGQLVTFDVPSGVVDQATVTRRGLTLKYANDLFCLPLPGDGEDKEYRRSPKACYQWKSKKFVFPGTMTLAAGKIVHACGGKITVRLYVDCKCVWQANICDCEPFRIPSQIIGTEFEIELLGTQAVYEVHFASSMQELLEE